MLIGGICFAQQLFETYYGDHPTITWDPVAEPANGTQTYVIWMTDRNGWETIVGETVLPPYTLDVTMYSTEVFPGVQTKIVLDNGTELPSEIIWSYDGRVEYVPVPFVLLRGAQAVKNFKIFQDD